MNTILVADDDADVRSSLCALGGDGYHPEFVGNGDDVLERVQFRESDFALILLDVRMLRKDVLETLQEVRRIRPEIPVIMRAGDSSPVNLVTLMNAGVIDFLPKPVHHEELLRVIRKALQITGNDQPVASPMPREQQPAISFVNVWSRKLELLLEKVGASDVPVLLRGETGVGKEVLARKLHARSARAGEPFLKLNCVALPSELVESELFGYERGAFTGAFKSTPGKFEMANRGTLLLDEIGDMDFKLQAKLLHVIQDREFLRLGAKEPSKVDVRIMAATHCDLEQAIVEGCFREDLYYRLNIIDIHIPPLRDRTDEILPLAEFFIDTNATPSMPVLPIPPALADALLEHKWPGNIRELENVIRKYLVLRDAKVVAGELHRRTHSGSVPAGAAAAYQAGGASSHLNGAEREESKSLNSSILKTVDRAHKTARAEAIVAALNTTRWNRKQAAALLKLKYKVFLYEMKKLGIGENTCTPGLEPPVTQTRCRNSNSRAQRTQKHESTL